MNIITIDPGKQGGVAVFSDGVPGAFPLYHTEENEVDAIRLLGLFLSVKPDWICIERQWARPGNGVKSAGSTMFGYGKLIATAELYCETYDCELMTPTPREWQIHVIPKTKRGETKKASIKHAKKIYPLLSLLRTPRCKKPHDGMADALCMLTWARRAASPS